MSFITDLRNALRSLLGSPLFLSLAVFSLALGIGVNAAMFSLFDQMLLRPLQVAQPERLVNLVSPGPRWGSTSNNDAGSRDSIFSYPMYRDLRAADSGLEGLAAHRGFGASIAIEGASQVGRVLLVSGNYFGVLGLAPAAGRLIAPGDESSPGEAQVAVLGHGFWKNRLGGDEAVLGKTLRINGQSLTVVGVAPEGFGGTTLGAPSMVFVPISLSDRLQPDRPPALEDRRNYWAYLFGRLAEGQTAESVAARLQPQYQRLLDEVELPLQSNTDERERAEFAGKPLLLEDGSQGQSSIRLNSQLGLTIMLAVSLLVLCVACLNVANLQLARGTQRSGQVALRAAIGAGRGRLVRELFTESLLLGLLGALAAIPVAHGVLFALSNLLPDAAANALVFSVDGRVLTYSIGAAVFSALLFGALPAWQLARTSPMEVLRQSATQSAHPVAARFRTFLAVLQVCLSTASLVLAGLFAQSLDNIFESDPGMQIDRVVSFSVAPRRSGYDDERAAQLIDRLRERVAGMPGVASATTSTVPLLSGNDWSTTLTVQGYTPADGEDPLSSYNEVGSGFFRTLGIPLLTGREFTDADAQGRPRVAVVNRAFAERFGLGSDAVGKRIAIGTNREPDVEIVGLAETTSYDDITRRDQPQFFTPIRQGVSRGAVYFLLKSDGPVEPLLEAVPRIVAEVDPNLPLHQVGTIEQDVREHHALEAMVSRLSGGFAVLATVLAALGVYGVVNYSLHQRLREFGLRMALGAAPPALRRQILRQSFGLFLVGAVLGLALGAASGRGAEALLFGIGGTDLTTFAAAFALLAVIVGIASWLPALRAGRIDPMEALRHE